MNSSRPAIGPLHVLEHHDDGLVCGHPLKEHAPPREQLGLTQVGLREPEQRPEARRDEFPVSRVRHPLAEAGDIFADTSSSDASSGMPRRCLTISDRAQ